LSARQQDYREIKICESQYSVKYVDAAIQPLKQLSSDTVAQSDIIKQPAVQKRSDLLWKSELI
jgi:hypothetical protein